MLESTQDPIIVVEVPVDVGLNVGVVGVEGKSAKIVTCFNFHFLNCAGSEIVPDPYCPILIARSTCKF